MDRAAAYFGAAGAGDDVEPLFGFGVFVFGLVAGGLAGAEGHHGGLEGGGLEEGFEEAGFVEGGGAFHGVYCDVGVVDGGRGIVEVHLGE